MHVERFAQACVPAVQAFNARLKAGGWDGFGLPEALNDHPDAARSAGGIRKTHFVVVDGGDIRGGFLLQRQPFWLADHQYDVANYQAPLSEGLTCRRYAHVAAVMIFTMGVFALSRSGDAVSVDALIRRRRGLPPPGPSGEYRWPVRMVWVLMSVLFFNAGMAKAIRGPVHTWIFSENMAVLMTQRHYQNSNALPPLDWGLFIAKHPVLYHAGPAGIAALFISFTRFDVPSTSMSSRNTKKC